MNTLPNKLKKNFRNTNLYSMTSFYSPCMICKGHGKIATISKRTQNRYKKSLKLFEEGKVGVIKPKPLVAHVDICLHCIGSGLLSSENFPYPDPLSFPNIAIIGGGIGGVALAVACLHRGIPYTLYERDESFDARSQGYGLTLQQASKAIEGLGIFDLENSITSTRHVVHDPVGEIIGEWGMRKLGIVDAHKPTKRRNIHISRQALRCELLSQLHDEKNIVWGYRLKSISQKPNFPIELEFDACGKREFAQADLVVGADGIRSCVRSICIGEDKNPLHYLGCIVILGICSLDALGETRSPLLDGKTVFQTVNGHERIYMMPYDANMIMWQLSFPMSEEDAKKLSKNGSVALKHEAIERLKKWHAPIPEILAATDISRITGYPVYDREILEPEFLNHFGNITLIGDAMHPMSPFKGQGANQALLDALELARDIYTKCGSDSKWREKGLRETLLIDFEKQMLNRSKSKVQDSAIQAELLHSAAVLHDGDMPRGRGIGEIHSETNALYLL